MINYYTPGFVEAQRVYKILFWLRDNAPRCFYPNVNISKIFGCFPNMIWNGGTFWLGLSYNVVQIRDYFDWYATKNVQLQLTFTNPILQPTDLYDRYCNAVLDIASEYDFVEILVTSDILEEYIRNKHPHMKIDKSIIGMTHDIGTDKDNLETYLEMANKYNMCVLPRKYSKDIDFLSQIPEDKRNKFELLGTDPCPVTCPRLYTHYEDFARRQLWETGQQDYCSGIDENNPFRHWVNRQYQYTYEELKEVYEPMGFTEIKLSGRIDMIKVILSTIPFLIKPEFQKDVYCAVLNYYSTITVPPDFD